MANSKCIKKITNRNFGNQEEPSEFLISSSEFVPGRLYFAILKSESKPKYTPNSHYFTVDEELVYYPFFEDFGPLNLAHLYRYCTKLNKKLKAFSLLSKKIIHYTTANPEKCVNAAYLIGSYAVIYLKMTPDDVYNKLMLDNTPGFMDFRDASNSYAVYKISLLDCLHAIHKAHQYNFFNFDDFNYEEYEHYETVENGDLNWIIPGKFIAFAGPHSRPFASERNSGYPIHTPESYVKYFRENNVTTIVRLNNKLYDATRFTKEGFIHKDLFFFDGSTPGDDLVHKFLQLSEETNGGVAVHCKAGLGRTGSMIACYIMKWYHFTAREAISWLRVCRPASIIGHQQEWLEEKQVEMWSLEAKLNPKRHKYGVYSIQAKSDKSLSIGLIKPVRRIRPFPIDNVNRIVSKVDSMSIDYTGKDENKNCEIISDKESTPNGENVILSQGDKLYEIKAARNYFRMHHTRPVRPAWNLTPTTASKRSGVMGKMTHTRRQISRSKSSLTPPTKSAYACDETNKTSQSKNSIENTVPLNLAMTLRSKNRSTRTVETRPTRTTTLR